MKKEQNSCSHSVLAVFICEFVMGLMLITSEAIFILFAAIGDKTQFATQYFAANNEDHMMIVITDTLLTLALVSKIAVLLCCFAAQHLSQKHSNTVVGMGFAINLWTLSKT